MSGKPRWFYLLPTHMRPKKARKIQAIEQVRNKYGLLDEVLARGIMLSPWAFRKLQYFRLRQVKKEHPFLPDKHLWKMVLLSAFYSKLDSKGRLCEEDDEKYWQDCLTAEDIRSLIGDIDEILSRFRSFKEVVDYIIYFHEETGRLPATSGIQKELHAALEGIRGLEPQQLSSENPLPHD